MAIISVSALRGGARFPLFTNNPHPFPQFPIPSRRSSKLNFRSKGFTPFARYAQSQQDLFSSRLQDGIENLPKLVEDIVQTSINTGPRGALRLAQGIQAFLGVGGEWLADASKSTNSSAGLPTQMQLGLLSPQYLRRLFERMGATYIKLGQFIASAPTLFPAEYVQEFQNCFDRAPAVPFQEIQAILREELGRPIDSVYEYVDPTPVASASIAQVHAARLKDSQDDVVIKVLKPGIKDILVADLNFVYIVARILEFLNPELSRASLVGIVKDIRESMLEEVNFYKEAANIEAFRNYLEAMGLTRQATAPKVYQHCSTQRILTMERLYGVPLTDLDSISSLVSSPETSLITALNVWYDIRDPHACEISCQSEEYCIRFFNVKLIIRNFLSRFGSLLACETFHADVHAGNLWLLRDGRIGFLDFAYTGYLEDFVITANGYLSRFSANSPSAKFRDGLTKVGSEPKTLPLLLFVRVDLDTELIVATARDRTTNATAVSANVVVDERQMNALFLDVIRVSESYGLKFPREFALLMKQLLYFDRYTRLLAPNLNMLQDQRISIVSNRGSRSRNSFR
ncbi:hypothetical protein NC651_040035 [Populus alba x Populus x berolinensis]|nr:hypothetical protein NC651_040035 [Populus alba x Populus x berolinensis]